MDSRLYNIINYKSKNADQIIKERFTAAFMSNAKWVKMINTLAYKFGSIFFNYKLIYDDVVQGSLFDIADVEPFFIEPIKYKEVEWIEFPSEYENWINGNNLKAGKELVKQDIEKIKQELKKIGKFHLEFHENDLKLYAYK